MISLDQAIINYRKAVKIHAQNTVIRDVSNANWFESHKQVMFAKDDLREAERNEREVPEKLIEAPTKLILKTI